MPMSGDLPLYQMSDTYILDAGSDEKIMRPFVQHGIINTP